jgi:hypothetical protein
MTNVTHSSLLCIYFNSLRVSSTLCSSSGETNCINAMALECRYLSVGYITLDVPSLKLRKQFFVFCDVGQPCNLIIRGCASNSFAFLVISNTMHVPAHLRSSYSQIRSCIYIYIYINIHVHMCIMYITVLLWSLSL